ncbi:MAG: hypothetical protein LBF69_02335 [Prevotellaceae bacterium]|jgi:hypothetical protein|nr:hypothetical protein [Prevotellaceae bacterium]
MKTKILIFPFLVAALCCFSSCAIHNGLTNNVNNSTTNVILQKNNYKIIKKVQGSASGLSVFGIGGSFQPLIAKARAKMLENAGLQGGSKAIINEIVEVNNKGYIMVFTKTITVSAYVIEFTE